VLEPADVCETEDVEEDEVEEMILGGGPYPAHVEVDDAEEEEDEENEEVEEDEDDEEDEEDEVWVSGGG
jgi:hypothetical protein